MEELNKRAEDPELWNKPERAQSLMQERTRLETAIKTCRQLEADMNEYVEMIELGEAEGDSDVVTESEAALAALCETASRLEVEALLSARPIAMIAISKCMRAPGAQKAKTGRR